VSFGLWTASCRKKHFCSVERPLYSTSPKVICVMKNFKKLSVWQKAFQISINCFRITTTFPKEERFGLVSQINRSAISVTSNIAEGSGRASPKDYKRFLDYSLGSTFELETQLLIAKELKYGDLSLIDQTLLLIDEEEKMLISFGKTLMGKPNS
jgi:four helix bundle protein